MRRWNIYLVYNLSLKRKILLSKETDNHRNNRHYHLRWSRVDTAHFYKQLQPEIVHQQVHYHNQNISPKLLISTQRRLRKRHVFIQPKSRKQRNWKHYQQCHHVRSKAYLRRERQSYIHQLMPHHKIIKNKVQYPIQHHVAATTSRIPK